MFVKSEVGNILKKKVLKKGRILSEKEGYGWYDRLVSIRRYG